MWGVMEWKGEEEDESCLYVYTGCEMNFGISF